jgi:hypothetical protein
MGTFKVAFDGGERAILDVCFGESWPPKMCSARGGAPEKFKHDDRRGDPEQPYLDIDAAEEGAGPGPWSSGPVEKVVGRVGTRRNRVRSIYWENPA